MEIVANLTMLNPRIDFEKNTFALRKFSDNTFLRHYVIKIQQSSEPQSSIVHVIKLM